MDTKDECLPISFPQRLGMRFMILKHDGSSLHNDLANKQFRLPVGEFSSEKNIKRKTYNIMYRIIIKKKTVIQIAVGIIKFWD